MGFKVELGGFIHELESFSVQEAATPLSAGDSTGQVGTVSLTIRKPDLDLPGRDTLWRTYGAQMLQGRPIRLSDGRKGFTLGTVTAVSEPAGGVITVTGVSRLGELNVYNVQAQPFRGTLGAAFSYYCGLANINTDLFVDPAIASQTVVFPGFSGELWYNLKQLAVAVDADISLVSGVILLRPIRAREATRNRGANRSLSVGGSLAQSVEVYNYQNRSITNELVYPTDGWSEEVAVINVNSGEYLEERIELSASVLSIQQPVMQTFVARDYTASSVFTVVGDDGLPIQPAQWVDYGGSLSIDINPDTTSLTVKIQAPSGIPNKDGNEIGVYGIALSSDESTGRYSTLRVVGSGVAFKKELVRIPTGVPASATATEVGATIDNPFLGSLEQVYRAGTRAARAYSGRALTLSSEVVAVNRLGDTGQATYPTYAFEQSLRAGQTYNDVLGDLGAQSYDEIQGDLFDLVRNDFDNQVFGNVNGARYYDTPSKRWYRIRSANLSPSTISFEAEDDLTHNDMEGMFVGQTYNAVQAIYSGAGATYAQADLMGMVLR